MKAKLFDYARISDSSHKDFGRTGFLGDFNFENSEFVLHFGKLNKEKIVIWDGDSTSVRQEQLKKIYQFELDKINS